MSIADARQIRPSAAVPSLVAISPESYLFLQGWIYRESGIVIDHDKRYLLQSRLASILERENLATMDNLCGKLRSGMPNLARQVIEAITTNETLFFRDRAPFDALRDHILPTLLKRRTQGQKLAFWSAAASSGQEAYSLAILLLEMGLSDHDVDIFGSDLSEQVLTRARLGRYRDFEVSRGLPVQYLNRYFDRVGKEWLVKDHVRKMARFQQLDLRNSLRSYGPFDVVFCRNVLIYFDSITKAKILSEVRTTLACGGYLILGAAETTGSLNAAFLREVIGDAVAYVAV